MNNHKGHDHEFEVTKTTPASGGLYETSPARSMPNSSTADPNNGSGLGTDGD